MKKQDSSIKAQIIRSAFILLAFTAMVAIPLALAQRQNLKRQQPRSPIKAGNPAASSNADLPEGVVVCSYTFTSSTGVPFVPGVTDIGNHCDDCSTNIPLPFPVILYDQSYTSANAGSNGYLAFGIDAPNFTDATCWPSTSGTYVLAPYWTDQCTDNTGMICSTQCAGCGIFTTTTGTAPNRVFYIEYRTSYYQNNLLDYEIALFENGSPPFRYIYNTINPASAQIDSSLVVGVKKDNVSFTQYGCDCTGGQDPPVSSGQALTAALA